MVGFVILVVVGGILLLMYPFNEIHRSSERDEYGFPIEKGEDE